MDEVIPQKKLCSLCERNRFTSKHHLIPQAITKEINKGSPFKDVVVKLCDDCHRAVHQHYITHVMNSKRFNLLNKYDAVQYKIIQTLLKKEYPEVWKHYVVIRKGMVEEFNNLEE